MGNTVSCLEMRELLEEELWEGEGEVLTTIGEVKLADGHEDNPVIIKLVVKGEQGPVIMSGELMSKNDTFREALVYIGGGYSEFPFDYPALAVPSIV